MSQKNLSLLSHYVNLVQTRSQEGIELAPYKPWPDDEKVWLKANYAKRGLAYCSKHLHRSKTSVRKNASRLGCATASRWLTKGKQT